ncbi:folic acid synthesis protein FOL1 [Nitrospirota bacterium]|nr:folic acid synthesis protein FOL1 [Nitrospirota bacterium]
MGRETVFIGFGSNVGDRLDFCDRAVTLLSLLPHSQLLGVSLLYETEPVNDHAQPGDGWFLNGVVRIETDITPNSLLTILREIERALGRDEENRSGPRTIDLDILFYGQRIIDEPDLAVPHPRMHQRRFVLMPLNELDPLFLHPSLQRTVSQLLAEAEKQPEVRLLFLKPRLAMAHAPLAASHQAHEDPSRPTIGGCLE